jgi:hypothetical protein
VHLSALVVVLLAFASAFFRRRSAALMTIEFLSRMREESPFAYVINRDRVSIALARSARDTERSRAFAAMPRFSPDTLVLVIECCGTDSGI